MYQDQVMVRMGDWAKARLRTLGKNDTIRFNSRVGSGFGKNIAHWVGRDMAYPDNVLHFATECSNKNHSAAFPLALPEWFIRLFTNSGDWVLDPFTGSGTTNLAAKLLDRNSVGIDLKSEHVRIATARLHGAEAHSPEKRVNGNGTARTNNPGLFEQLLQSTHSGPG